jgi:hypothetical protein
VTEEVAAQPIQESPVKVVIGAHVNDIQELDLGVSASASPRF